MSMVVEAGTGDRTNTVGINLVALAGRTSA